MTKIPPTMPGVIEYRVEIHDGVRRTFQDVHCTHPGCTEVMRTSITGDMKPADVIMTMAKRRAVFFELDSAYENKGYKSGFSDEVIAKKVGVSIQLVREIREENFGPTGHDSRIQELKTHASHLAQAISRVEDEAMKHFMAAETATKKLKTDLDSLQERIAELENLL